MSGTGLAKYDAMVKAIAVAYKVDEVKKIRDQAAALERYAKLAKDVDNERRCCEIRLRAERKAGQLLKKLPKAKGGGRGKKLAASRTTKGRLKNAPEVSHNQSKKWQKLANPSDEQFEAALDQADMPTTAGIIKATTPPKENPVAAEALWLWGRLKDFERDGLLAKEPAEVMATMTSNMLDDVHTLAPRVAAWLRKIGATHGAQGESETQSEGELQQRGSGGPSADRSEDSRHAA
jgi:hypothetical protein